jgi:hypothetical protein
MPNFASYDIPYGIMQATFFETAAYNNAVVLRRPDIS